MITFGEKKEEIFLPTRAKTNRSVFFTDFGEVVVTVSREGIVNISGSGVKKILHQKPLHNNIPFTFA